MIDHLRSEVEALAISFASVPAPTFDEGARREAVRAEWESRGLASRVDGAGNLIARVRSGPEPGIVVCAHLDTVFPSSVDHSVESTPDRLVGPGIGDDSLGLAALSVLESLLPDEMNRAVWLAATTGEEGLGNLAGVSHLLDNPPGPVAALVAVEGTFFSRVITRAVGSHRVRIVFEGPGGHAWHQSHRPSAVHAAGRVVAALDDLALNLGKGSSLNVGSIGGGEAINARARSAWVEVDLRAEDPDVLARLKAELANRLSVAEIEVTTEILGARPAGRVDESHPLARSAAAALEAHGVRPAFEAASTDANAALDRGVPAIAVGISDGGNEHTEQEWVGRSSIAVGTTVLAETLVRAASSLT